MVKAFCQNGLAVSGHEWAELLNIGKPAKEMLAMKNTLPIDKSSLRYLCPLGDVQKFAEGDISTREVRAVVCAFSLLLPMLGRLLDQMHIMATHETWFWSRKEIYQRLNAIIEANSISVTGR
jgi:hypothetical protein